MNGLSGTAAEAGRRFAEIEGTRELSLTFSRRIIRNTKRMIHAIHTGEDRSGISEELRKDAESMLSAVRDEPSVSSSAPVSDALSEYAEAFILDAVAERRDIPTFGDLGIPAQCWVMGLADVPGELRRMVLNRLSSDDLEGARYLFGCMEEIGDEVLGFDVPDAIVPLRRKQDIARGVIERTRSDVTNAIVISRGRGE